MNVRHHWRLRCIPPTTSPCILCDSFYPSTQPVICSWFDHDLAALAPHRGHVCNDCAPLLRDAEVLLVGAGMNAPSDSIMEGGNQ